MSEEKKGFFARLKAGLTKTRDSIVRGIDSVFNGFSTVTIIGGHMVITNQISLLNGCQKMVVL